jgi:hypothetical protein
MKNTSLIKILRPADRMGLIAGIAREQDLAWFATQAIWNAKTTTKEAASPRRPSCESDL